MFKEGNSPSIQIVLDPDRTKEIDIYFQDVRPKVERQRSRSVLGKLRDAVDCFELSFEDPNKEAKYRKVFFNDEELDKIFENARLAVSVSRSYQDNLDPKSGRLLRYTHEEAVQLGIIPGIAVVNMG